MATIYYWRRLFCECAALSVGARREKMENRTYEERHNAALRF